MSETSSGTTPLGAPETTPPAPEPITTPDGRILPPMPETQGRGIFDLEDRLDTFVTESLPKAIARRRLESTEKEIASLESGASEDPRDVAKSDNRLHKNMRLAVVNNNYELIEKRSGHRSPRMKRIFKKNARNIKQNARDAQRATGILGKDERLEHLGEKKRKLQEKLGVGSADTSSSAVEKPKERTPRRVISVSDRAAIIAVEQLLKDGVESITPESLDTLLKKIPGYTEKLTAFTLNRLRSNVVIGADGKPIEGSNLRAFADNLLYGEKSPYRPDPAISEEQLRRVTAQPERGRKKHQDDSPVRTRTQEAPGKARRDTDADRVEALQPPTTPDQPEKSGENSFSKAWAEIEQSVLAESQKRKGESDFTASFNAATVIRDQLRQELIDSTPAEQVPELLSRFAHLDAVVDAAARADVEPFFTEEYFNEINDLLQRYINQNVGRYKRVHGLSHGDALSEEAQDDIETFSADQAIRRFLNKYHIVDNDRTVKALGIEFGNFFYEHEEDHQAEGASARETSEPVDTAPKLTTETRAERTARLRAERRGHTVKNDEVTVDLSGSTQEAPLEEKKHGGLGSGLPEELVLPETERFKQEIEELHPVIVAETERRFAEISSSPERTGKKLYEQVRKEVEDEYLPDGPPIIKIVARNYLRELDEKAAEAARQAKIDEDNRALDKLRNTIND